MSCTATNLELPVLHERVNLQEHCCENIRSSKIIQCSMKDCIYSAVSRNVHRLFQNEFSREYDIVLPLSISSILFFIKVIQ
jgi:hypothetical protein